MKSVLSVTVEIRKGCDLGDAACDLSALSRMLNVRVSAMFNETLLEARPDLEVYEVVNAWIDRRRNAQSG